MFLVSELQVGFDSIVKYVRKFKALQIRKQLELCKRCQSSTMSIAATGDTESQFGNMNKKGFHPYNPSNVSSGFGNPKTSNSSYLDLCGRQTPIKSNLPCALVTFAHGFIHNLSFQVVIKYKIIYTKEV